MDEPSPVQRRQRGVAVATARLAVVALAARQHRLRPAVGAEADDLEPAVGVGQVQEAAAGQGPRTGRPLVAASRDPPFLAGGELDDVQLRQGEIGGSERLRRDRAPVGRPGEVLDVETGRRDRPRLGRLRVACRTAATRDRRVHDEDLRPAATPRDERDLPAIGRPAGHRPAGRMRRNEDVAAPVDVHDPDVVAAGVGEPPSVG